VSAQALILAVGAGISGHRSDELRRDEDVPERSARAGSSGALVAGSSRLRGEAL
jgi:hypothetical protein